MLVVAVMLFIISLIVHVRLHVILDVEVVLVLLMLLMVRIINQLYFVRWWLLLRHKFGLLVGLFINKWKHF